MVSRGVGMCNQESQGSPMLHEQALNSASSLIAGVGWWVRGFGGWFFACYHQKIGGVRGSMSLPRFKESACDLVLFGDEGDAALCSPRARASHGESGARPPVKDGAFRPKCTGICFTSTRNSWLQSSTHVSVKEVYSQTLQDAIKLG